MTATAIDHLNFTVNSFDESAEWYGRVFGFRVVERQVDEGLPWGVLRSDDGAGGSMLCIYEAPQRELLDRFALRDRGQHGFAHFGVRIRDEAAWLQTLQRENLQVLYGGVVEWPHSKSWYIKDPTGYEIEVALWNEDRVSFEGAAMEPSE
jgi:lactoylglutathione lyase